MSAGRNQHRRRGTEAHGSRTMEKRNGHGLCPCLHLPQLARARARVRGARKPIRLRAHLHGRVSTARVWPVAAVEVVGGRGRMKAGAMLLRQTQQTSATAAVSAAGASAIGIATAMCVRCVIVYRIAPVVLADCACPPAQRLQQQQPVEMDASRNRQTTTTRGQRWRRQRRHWMDPPQAYSSMILASHLQHPHLLTASPRTCCSCVMDEDPWKAWMCGAVRCGNGAASGGRERSAGSPPQCQWTVAVACEGCEIRLTDTVVGRGCGG